MATIHRYKGLESAVVVLVEVDGRIAEDDLASLLYAGATRARSHLVVVASEPLAPRVAPSLIASVPPTRDRFAGMGN